MIFALDFLNNRELCYSLTASLNTLRQKSIFISLKHKKYYGRSYILQVRSLSFLFKSFLPLLWCHALPFLEGADQVAAVGKTGFLADIGQILIGK